MSLQGKLNLEASMENLINGKPRASVVPASLDLTDCPYMWPYCLQSLYATAQPVIFNATVLNGLGTYGTFSEPPQWIPKDQGGQLLDVLFTYSEALWPWSGHVSLHITVKDAGAKYTGLAHGDVKFTVESPPARGERVCTALCSLIPAHSISSCTL
jgi:membrane-bound transcription factor site-1 protease